MFSSIKKWWDKNKTTTTEKNVRKPLLGPFYSFSDFEVGDLVTVKPGVVPGGRYSQPIEAIDYVPTFEGDGFEPAFFVRGVPYYPEELILIKKKPKTIKGLWE